MSIKHVKPETHLKHIEKDDRFIAKLNAEKDYKKKIIKKIYSSNNTH